MRARPHLLAYHARVDWNDVRYFLSLARLGSIRAAGASLGVSHSTVARRVEALEIELSTRLFDRNRDGYTLTTAGTQMVPGAERVEREMLVLERELAGQDERLAGPIRLTCCDEFIPGMMVQALAELSGRYPEIELEITTDSRSFDLSRGEADIAVRMLGVAAQPPEYLIGRKLAPVYCANYVAIDHAERLDPDGEGTCPRWIGFDDRKQVEAMIAATSYATVPAWGAFSSLSLMVQAMRAGLGMAMLPCYVGEQQAGVRRLGHPDLQHVANVWLLSHPDLRDNARFQAARQCASQAIIDRESLFRGVVSDPVGCSSPDSS